MYDSTTPLASRSAKTVAVDNLMRRALRVPDPGDPQKVAEGLLARYPDVADQIERERLGLNHRTVAEPKKPNGAGRGGASSVELSQAHDDLERDLATLGNASELKDISVELKGWGRAVRKVAAEGLAAAPLALVIDQHDRAMAARRVLGDYARLARYVGTVTGDGATRFRRLGQSLDVMGALILVGIGEGLAANGVTRGTAIIRVAASELQTRRDAVIGAMRALTGSGHAVLGQDEYPRGLEAYRILVQRLEEAGQSDLRALLDEAAMSLALDQLVDLAAGATAEGLRELTTASAILVGRLERLVGYCRTVEVPLGSDITGSPESPPLTFFASALQMFVDAFRTTAGGRLITIARPAIITYGLYGMAAPDQAARRLGRIAVERNVIAEQLDCHACGCDRGAAERQILLDFLLERLDRAIDLYGGGSDAGGQGTPEVAAASWALIHRVSRTAIPEIIKTRLPKLSPDLRVALDRVEATLRQALPAWPTGPHNLEPWQRDVLFQELNVAFFAEKRIETLVDSLTPGCTRGPKLVRAILKRAIEVLGLQPQPQALAIMPPDPAASMATFLNIPIKQLPIR